MGDEEKCYILWLPSLNIEEFESEEDADLDMHSVAGHGVFGLSSGDRDELERLRDETAEAANNKIDN